MKKFCIILATIITITFITPYIQVPLGDANAANESLLKYGDIDENNYIDCFDLITVRNKMNNKIEIGKNVMSNYYLNGLSNFLLQRTNIFDVDMTIDNDEDGLTNWDEINSFSTSPDAKDTDSDGLYDSYEIIILQTDPLNVETDAVDDFDEDGLSNLEEQENNTNPYHADSDSDNLTDFDELNKYNTNPLNNDCDDDGIIDGDEIKLGLDPKNNKTKGYDDKEHITLQQVDIDNSVVQHINNEDNPYELSLEIEAAGCVDSCLKIVESGYSEIMKSAEPLGYIPEFIYDQEHIVKNVTLRFRIKDEYVEHSAESTPEELSGINRFCIFKYFEDINMLLPLETEYDTVNNTVYIELDNFEADENGESYGIGSYCIVDMTRWNEALIGAYTEQKEYASTSTESDTATIISNDVNILSSGEVKGEIYDDNLKKISFIDSITEIAKEIVLSAGSNSISLDGGQTNIDYFYMNGHKYAIFDDTGLSWSEAQLQCKKMGGHLATITNATELWYLENVITQNSKNKFYWVGATKSSSNNWQSWCTGESMEYVNSIRVYGYGISHFKYDSLYYAIGRDYISSFSNGNCGYICEWEPGRTIRSAKMTNYFPIFSFATKALALSDKLSSNNKNDTDGDGRSDYDEIDFKSIKKISGGKNTATLLDCVNYISNTGFKLTKDFLKSKVQSVTTTDNIEDIISKINVYPMASDPTNSDYDNDGFIDSEDPNPNKSDITIHKLEHNEYLQIERDNTIHYGSNQSWAEDFANNEYYNNNNQCNNIHNSGCGLTATADALTYLNIYKDLNFEEYAKELGLNSETTTTTSGKHTADILNHIKYDNKTDIIDYKYYMDYVFKLHEKLKTYDSLGLGTVPMILPNNISSNINKAFKAANSSYRAYWGRDYLIGLPNDNIQKNMYTHITRMLDDNLPVIISFCHVNYKITLPLYKYIDGKMTYAEGNNTNGHYMVVTELIEYSSDATKNIIKQNGENINSFDAPCIMLKVASWGTSYYINLNEYCDLTNNSLFDEHGAFDGIYNYLANDFQSNILYINDVI